MKKYHNRVEYLSKLCSGKDCVEIGVNRGKYAAFIASVKPKSLYLIDIWDKSGNGFAMRSAYSVQGQKEAYQKAVKAMKPYDFVKFMKAWSVEAASRFKDNSLDFVYIDADHAYDACQKDMDAWWPKVKKGGWMCGHDYESIPAKKNETVVEVKDAVDDWLKFNKLELGLITLEPSPSWGIQK